MPGAEPLLFRQKWPKPCWPWHGPSDALRGSPTPAAGKLAAPVLSLLEGLKHCPPFLRGRLHGSAMSPGQGIIKGKSVPPVGQPAGVRSTCKATEANPRADNNCEGFSFVSITL